MQFLGINTSFYEYYFITVEWSFWMSFEDYKLAFSY